MKYIPDRETDGVWLRDNGDIPPYTNWASSQPDEVNDFECAYGTWSNEGGVWNANSCGVSFNVVCERPFGTTTTTTTTTSTTTTTTTLPGKMV